LAELTADDLTALGNHIGWPPAPALLSANCRTRCHPPTRARDGGNGHDCRDCRCYLYHNSQL